MQPKLKSSNDMFMAQLLLCTGMQEKSQPSMQTNQISGEEKEKKPLQHQRAGRYGCMDKTSQQFKVMTNYSILYVGSNSFPYI